MQTHSNISSALRSLGLTVTLFAIAIMTITTTACPGREVAKVDPIPSPIPDKRIPVNSNRDVDILFVIDNSGSMRLEQVSLAANFPEFINVLSAIEGGLPNVHIGVISTDTGADGAVCSANGDNGELQGTDAQGTGCAPPSDKYIRDIGDTGTINYTGTLAETFSCIAELGDDGCGFESPLDSVRRALSTGANPGFVRENALLAIIFITDEDDCSVGMGERNEFLNNSDALGPLSSFRCFEYGVQCDDTGGDIRAPGAKDECQSREDSPYLTPVSEFVDFVAGIKPDPSQVIVAGIIGPPDISPAGAGFRSAVRPNERRDEQGNPRPNDPLFGTPQLSPSCTSPSGEAAPGIRLAQFIGSFINNRTTTICNEDLSDALQLVATLLAEVIGTPCLAPNAIEPLECEAWVEDRDGNTLFQVPQCGTAPCWEPVTDPQCNGAPGVQFMERGDEPLGSKFRIQCLGAAT